MDLRAKIFVLLFIVLAVSLLPVFSKRSENGTRHGKKKKSGQAYLSPNIGENPFLNGHITTGPTTTTSAPPVNSYQGNPFLNNSLKLHLGNGTNPRPIPSNSSAEGDSLFEPGMSPRPRRKSDLKCEEYHNEITTTEISPLVGTNNGPQKIFIDDCWPVNSLVIGGKTAYLGEYPHMAALGRFESETFVLLCGGTIISPDWILTAAHCTAGPNGAPNIARIGIADVSNNQAGLTISITTITRHPNYRPPAVYADIGLMKLQTPVTFGKLIRPACLYQLYDNAPERTWVTGWGVTEFAGDQSDKLQKARLDVIDNVACAISHNRTRDLPYGITPSMICAGDPKSGWSKDTCNGDSGGPMQVRHQQYPCLFQVIGITSFGQGCAIADSPGVYTRVSHFLTWIEDTVWPDD